MLERYRQIVQPDLAAGDFFSQSQQNNGLFFPGQPEVNAELEPLREVSRSIINDMSGFDKWRIENGKGKIVDMYLTKPRTREIVSIPPEEALQRFARTQEQIAAMAGKDFSNLPPEWQYLHRNLHSVIVFSLEEHKQERVDSGEKGIEQMNYRDYITNVYGVEPRKTPDEVMETLRADLYTAAEDAGAPSFNWNNENSVKTAFRTYHERNKILRGDFESAKQQFKVIMDGNFMKYQRPVAEILGEEVNKVKVPLEFTERDEFWRMFETISLSEYFLLVNLHPDHRLFYNVGTLNMYAKHEMIGHFVQAHFIKKEIENGDLDPAAGIVTYPGMASWQLEGIAQTLGTLIELNEDEASRFATLEYRLEKRGLTNAVYDVEVNGVSVQDAATEFGKYAPLHNREIREKMIRNAKKRNQSGFAAIYGLADEDFMLLDRKFGSKAMRNVFVPAWVRRPATRDQIMNPDLDLNSLIYKNRYSQRQAS